MDVMDVVMRMRTAKGLQSQIRRFLSAPPQYSGSLQSQEKQERLSNMENVLKIRNHRVSFEKCPFLEIDTFQCKFYKGNIQNASMLVLVSKKDIYHLISQM